MLDIVHVSERRPLRRVKMLTWTKTSTRDDWLSIFGLQADVELKAVDVAVQLLSGVRNLGIGVPLQEARVR